MAKTQLIGADISLYTGKVRSYFNFKGIPYKEVTASKEIYKNVILPRTGVHYIPVVITDDDIALQDSTVIIDFMEARYPDASVYPSGPCQKLVSLLLEIYADEWLVIPAMYYRWAKPENREFAFLEFGRTSLPDGNEAEQYAVGEKLAEPFAGALPHLGISETNSVAIESSYLGLLDDLEQHFQHHPYLLGNRPSIGDFGLIGPLFAHLYRDPFSGRLMQQKAPAVAAWVRRMMAKESKPGDFLQADQVPDTLLPILSRMFQEQGPVIRTTIDSVTDWVRQNPNETLPRAIGQQTFSIEGIDETRLIYPYCQWMWQRAYDFYHGLEQEQGHQVRQLLDSIPQAIETLEHPLGQRLTRKQNRLVVDSDGSSSQK